MKHLLTIALVLAFNAFAEENTGTTEETAATSPDAHVVGRIDLRPSYVGQSATGWDYHTENMAELGYQFDLNTVLSYRQEFNTNIYNPTSEANGGIDPTAQGGFFRGQLKNVWVSEDKDWDLSLEARTYLPTNAGKRDAGMITAIRNYGILAYKASDTVDVSLFEIPIIHMYDRAGFGEKANPSFENRVYLDVFANLSEDITLEFPLMLYSTRTRSFSLADGTQAKNGNQWDHNLSIYPELLYKIDPTYTVGVSYSSGYLMEPDLSKFSIGSGLEKGTYQLVFIATL